MRTPLRCSAWSRSLLAAAWLATLALIFGCGQKAPPPAADQVKAADGRGAEATPAPTEPTTPPAVGTPKGDAPTAAGAPPDEKSKVYLEEEWGAARRLEAKGARIDWPNRNLHIVALSLEGGQLKDGDLADLRKLPHLRKLTVKVAEADQLSDAAFEPLAELKQLEELEIRKLGVSDDVCKFIGKLTALRALSLADTRVTDEGLREFTGLTRLEVLDVSGLPVTGDGLKHLAAAKGLRALDLRATRLRTEDLALIGKFTALETLLLPEVSLGRHSSAAPVYETHLLTPETRPDLAERERAKLPRERLDYALGLKHLSKLTRLKSPAMTGVFRECPKGQRSTDTQELRFDPGLGRATAGTDGESPQTVAFKAFYKFEFKVNEKGEWTYLEPQGVLPSDKPSRRELRPAFPELHTFLDRPHGSLLVHIRDYENVTTLDLSNLLLGDDDLKHLAKFTRLERLDLSGQYITKDGLAHLRHLPLKYLNLRGCYIGDEDEEAIRSIKTLRDVVLSQTRVTKEGAERYTRGALRAIYDDRQRRPWWCDANWRKLVDGNSRLDTSTTGATAPANPAKPAAPEFFSRDHLMFKGDIDKNAAALSLVLAKGFASDRERDKLREHYSYIVVQRDIGTDRIAAAVAIYQTAAKQKVKATEPFHHLVYDSQRKDFALMLCDLLSDRGYAMSGDDGKERSVRHVAALVLADIADGIDQKHHQAIATKIKKAVEGTAGDVKTLETMSARGTASGDQRELLERSRADLAVIETALKAVSRQ